MRSGVVIGGAVIVLMGGIMLLLGVLLYGVHTYSELFIYLVYSGPGVAFLGIAIALFGMVLDEHPSIETDQQPQGQPTYPQQQPQYPEQQLPQQYPPQP